MSKTVILTGLRANNDLHFGNYFGALLPLIDMAKKHSRDYQVNLMMADLHSFNTPVNHSTLYQQIIENIRVYAAAGLPLDIPDVCLFRESHVPAHSELMVILSNFSGYGEISRMTQFKDKAAKLSKERVTAGLFNYPVLMAADILLYNATYVPVGDDQTQHLEFTRDLAQRMNKRFGALFTVPKPVADQHRFFGKDQGLRVRDLLDPAKKMSKSDESGKGVIFLNDSPDEARQKVMAATTDSLGKINYDYQNQPGISNLLDILKLLGGDPNDFVGQAKYGPLKEKVSDRLADFVDEFQSKLKQVDMNTVMQKLETSEEVMNRQANQKLVSVQRAIGLRSKQ